MRPLLLVLALPLLVHCATRVEPPKAVPLPDVTNIVGRYAYDADDVIAFKADGDRLAMTRTAHAPVMLETRSATEFVDRETGTTYVFGRDMVTVGGATLQRTRAAIPFELLMREPKLGVMQYELANVLVLGEERLRARGEWLRQQGKGSAAVALLQFNVERHPGSAAAHDALATAHLAANDAAAARASSQKVLDVLAADASITPAQREVYRQRAESRLRDAAPQP